MALRCLYLGDGYLLKAIWQDISSLSFEYLSLRCSTLNAGLYPCSLTMLVRNILSMVLRQEKVPVKLRFLY